MQISLRLKKASFIIIIFLLPIIASNLLDVFLFSLILINNKYP